MRRMRCCPKARRLQLRQRGRRRGSCACQPLRRLRRRSGRQRQWMKAVQAASLRMGGAAREDEAARREGETAAAARARCWCWVAAAAVDRAEQRRSCAPCRWRWGAETRTSTLAVLCPPLVAAADAGRRAAGPEAAAAHPPRCAAPDAALRQRGRLGAGDDCCCRRLLHPLSLLHPLPSSPVSALLLLQALSPCGIRQLRASQASAVQTA